MFAIRAALYNKRSRLQGCRANAPPNRMLSRHVKWQVRLRLPPPLSLFPPWLYPPAPGPPLSPRLFAASQRHEAQLRASRAPAPVSKAGAPLLGATTTQGWWGGAASPVSAAAAPARRGTRCAISASPSLQLQEGAPPPLQKAGPSRPYNQTSDPWRAAATYVVIHGGSRPTYALTAALTAAVTCGGGPDGGGGRRSRLCATCGIGNL